MFLLTLLWIKLRYFLVPPSFEKVLAASARIEERPTKELSGEESRKHHAVIMALVGHWNLRRSARWALTLNHEDFDVFVSALARPPLTERKLHRIFRFLVRMWRSAKTSEELNEAAERVRQFAVEWRQARPAQKELGLIRATEIEFLVRCFWQALLPTTALRCVCLLLESGETNQAKMGMWVLANSPTRLHLQLEFGEAALLRAAVDEMDDEPSIKEWVAKLVGKTPAGSHDYHLIA